ncbi:MAG: polyketide cyclase [Cytophagaceae bacterium]|nr:polyketide cyclase [Cytophagaceae bacterium]|tara:strand:+ start:629 stop:1048 length:420 start_codon:yes stop_codon:yes gene_type:complete
MSDKKITVEASIDATIDKAWKLWTSPEHIIKWNSPSDDWHTPKAENDLKKGGRFVYRMEAKDGSFGFDFGGTYDEVQDKKKLTYTLDDDRKVEVFFAEAEDKTTVTETFDPENQNPVEMQEQGWKAILDNFKKYVEAMD